MRGEAAGEWTGSGAQALGLDGLASGGQLRALLEGRDPATGEVLRSRMVHVTGWDVTYSPPKSVSVLHAAGDPRIAAETLAAHRVAVRSALGYLESEACWTRRGSGGSTRLVGEGFVGAEYVHRVSRAGDAQLHSHVVIANMTRADGRWTTLGRQGAVRASEDRVGAVSRRVAGRVDATARGRVGAGGPGQAGGRDQGRAAGGVARSQPSSPGDPATDGGARGVQPSRRPGRGAGYAQGQGLRRRSARRCARAAHADRREGIGPGRARRHRRPSAAGATRQGRADAPFTRAARPVRHDGASVHVLAPRRHRAVGQGSPPGRIG